MFSLFFHFKWIISLSYFRNFFLIFFNYLSYLLIDFFYLITILFNLILLLLLAQQPLPVKACLYPLVKWARLSVTFCYRSRIVSPRYGNTVYSGLEPMTGMLLSHSSWRLYHQTGPFEFNISVYWITQLETKSIK